MDEGAEEMRLRLDPFTRSSKSTISKLFVNEVFECYVLEPASPIPAGVYEIKLQHSTRFGRIMPFLQNVPGHEGIEIHMGNTSADTRDCLLVGRTVSTDFVGQSLLAFDALFPKLEATSPITIDITRQAIPPAVPLEKSKGAVPMADPTSTTPTPAPAGKLTFTNHAPVTASLLGGAVTQLLIAFGKAKYGIDLAGQEGNLTLLIGAVIGYLTKGAIE
jgi:Family of unknown function (DUF5675)